MELKGMKVLVIGAGKTGMETARFLVGKGAAVSLSEGASEEKLGERAAELKSLGVELETGGHTAETFLAADVIIPSPGVPFDIPPLVEAAKKGARIMSEVELASRFIDKPVIAVTGSNGKTTTSTLIAAILRKGGKRVFLGANIGTPLISIAGKEDEYDVLVLELSSFQLQGVKTFHPNVAVVLNVSPNHLDHHSSFEEYAESKMNIFANQTPEDWCIYKADDEVIARFVNRMKSKKLPFGGPGNAISYDGTSVKFGDESLDLAGMKLAGYHNVENVMAAIAAARVMGAEPEVIRKAVVGFDPLPHRNEFIGEIRGAKFYNDSKSTSPGATERALESLPAPIILIAGGKDKGVSYDPLRASIREKVKLLVLFGESRFRMQKDLGGDAETVLADSLEDAVNKALGSLAPGDAVLFSPACSSFDMFGSYEERGRRYKDIVRNI
ncbi:MAG: UDP-N-acetylmuramoyl-L-alanine--D-glutamate ligase [Candidatus Dadabacteria bacterium]|nr:UDP-N-acetylmuramoyl-L-alanine--D-glutamate ligase [Candidatus Dadabacteria bacterium]